MNRIMLIGHVGKEPDLRYYDADEAVATFPLATTERGYSLPNGTQVPARTDWHNIVLWRGLAKLAEKYIHKGDKIYVEGKMQYRTYSDQKGRQHFVAEVIGENVELMSQRNNTTISNTNSANNNSSSNIQSQESAGNTATNSTGNADTNKDQDIPF